MIILSVVVGNYVNKWRRKHLPIKDIAYECGMLPVGEGNTRLSVKFYLVAMLFILFDIEVVFMYPWAVVYKSMLADRSDAEHDSVLHDFFPRHPFHWLHLRREKRAPSTGSVKLNRPKERNESATARLTPELRPLGHQVYGICN